MPKQALRLRRARPDGLFQLAQRWVPETVITGTASIPGHGASAELAMVSLVPRSSDGPIVACRYFAIPADASAYDHSPVVHRAVLSDFDKLLKTSNGTTSWGFVARDSFTRDWRAETYYPPTRADIANHDTSVPLDDLFQILVARPRTGFTHSADFDISCDPALTSEDVAFEILDPDPASATRSERAVVPLKSGDLLLARGHRSDQGWCVIEVDDAHAGVAAGRGVFVLREREPFERAERDFYISFFRSDRAARGSSGDAGPRFSRNLPVPVPTAELLHAIAELTSTRDALRARANEADALLKSVFDKPLP
ncbi:hypothetical protein [Cumulibacter soli]|uniref:hypothetical protein n=1 Tax=Cumulibacter soli TaxID=2546344 RepID=UPI0010679726|nr:hypothetical protein [Cumulibacter soli]